MGSLFSGGGSSAPAYQPLPPVQATTPAAVAPGTLQQTILSGGPAKTPADTLVGKPVTPTTTTETDEEERRRRQLLANSILGGGTSDAGGGTGGVGGGAAVSTGAESTSSDGTL